MYQSVDPAHTLATTTPTIRTRPRYSCPPHDDLLHSGWARSGGIPSSPSHLRPTHRHRHLSGMFATKRRPPALQPHIPAPRVVCGTWKRSHQLSQAVALPPPVVARLCAPVPFIGQRAWCGGRCTSERAGASALMAGLSAALLSERLVSHSTAGPSHPTPPGADRGLSYGRREPSGGQPTNPTCGLPPAPAGTVSRPRVTQRLRACASPIFRGGSLCPAQQVCACSP